MAAPPIAHHSAMGLRLFSGPGFLHEHSRLQSSSLPPPQAGSWQPTAVLSLGLLSKPQVPAPNPCAHQQTRLRLGRGGLWPDRLRRFVCPACHLLCSPPSFRSPPSAQLISLPVRGLPHMQEPPLLQLHPRGCRSHPTSSSFSLLSFYLVMWGCAILPLIYVSF